MISPLILCFIKVPQFSILKFYWMSQYYSTTYIIHTTWTSNSVKLMGSLKKIYMKSISYRTCIVFHRTVTVRKIDDFMWFVPKERWPLQPSCVDKTCQKLSFTSRHSQSTKWTLLWWWITGIQLMIIMHTDFFKFHVFLFSICKHFLLLLYYCFVFL